MGNLSPDIVAWRAEILRPPGALNGVARAAQQRINRLIPEKVHAAITIAISGMIQVLLIELH